MTSISKTEMGRKLNAWKDADKFADIFSQLKTPIEEHALYTKHADKIKLMDMIPDPPGGLPLRNVNKTIRFISIS